MTCKRIMGMCLVATLAFAAPAGAQFDGEWDFGLAGDGQDQQAPAAGAKVDVRAVASHSTVTPGQTFHVAAVFEVAEGFAWYSPNPGPGDPAPLSGDVDVEANGWPVGTPLWPDDAPHHYELAGEKLVHNAYEHGGALYVPITVPDDAAGTGRITVTLQGQICGNEVCIRLEGVRAEVDVDVGPAAVANPAWSDEIAQGLGEAKPASRFDAGGGAISTAGKGIGGEQSLGILAGLGLALLAGLILNVMPCVLPVIPLKVLGIVQSAKESRRRFVTLGLSFAFGIWLFFAAIAAVNIVLRLALEGAFAWGQHFQQPGFIIAMSLLLVALAANMFGVFNVTAPRKAAELEGRSHGKGHASSLGMGFLTGILSTPCSFAILASAFLWAQAQPLWLGTVGILTIGLGMAAPYAVLTAFPDLVKKLPRPGAWMERFKQGMGFVLLLVAVWLLSSMDGSRAFLVAGFAVVLVFALWMWGSWVRYDAAPRRKLLVRGSAVLLAGLAGWLLLTPPEPLAVKFEPFSRQRIAESLEAGQPVLIDFTAAWCMNCKVVEKTIYDDREVADELERRNAVAMKGDVTTKDMPAEALRARLGEQVPVTVIFPPDGSAPIRLRGFFSKQDLFDALKQAAGGTRQQ